MQPQQKNYLKFNTIMTKITNEGLERNDLQRLITPVLRADEFKSKLGRDEDVCVLSFSVVGGKEPGLDLVSFAEKGYDWVIDADVSPGEDADGNFIVFIEVERNSQVPEHIMELVTDLLNLTGQTLDEWQFAYRSSSKLQPLTVESLNSAIPLTSERYKKLFGQEAIDSLKAAAGVKVNTKAPKNEHTEQLRIAAGLK